MGTNTTHRPAGHRAVGYVRRSTDRQEQSIADQKRALEDYALEHGLRLGHFYIDDAVSGTSTVGRKAFQQMMQDAAKPECSFDIIVVYDCPSASWTATCPSDALRRWSCEQRRAIEEVRHPRSWRGRPLEKRSFRQRR